MQKFLKFIFAASTCWLMPPEAHATLLAKCGASEGQAYYDIEARWEPDRITNGSWEFHFDDKGNPNVYFRDSSGGLTDSAADGAQISVAFIHSKLQEFGLVVIYPSAGVVETFNVIQSQNGQRKLFWTSNKSQASRISKVAAFVAPCQ